MTDSSGLPVFAYVEDKIQTQQLREYFASLGAPINAKEEWKNDYEAIEELVKYSHVVGSQLESDNEVEMVLNSLVSLIVPLGQERVAKITEIFCAELTKDVFAGNKAIAAVRVLSNLFHGFGSADGTAQQHALQYHIYSSMLRIACENTGIVAELPTDIDTVKDWFKDWKLSTDQRRDCLRLLHSAFRGQLSAASNAVMMELLRSYTVLDAEKALPDARECVRSAISDPGTFILDHLLALFPVQSLEKEDPKIFTLLNIFVDGSLEDYLKFSSGNKDYLTKELKLDEDVLIMKMRILTLISIGEKEEEVNFDTLSSVLHIPVGEELEEFIIKSIQSKAIVAKIDQVGGKVLIGGVKNRKWERPQWEKLRGKLDAWAANMRQAKRHVDQVCAA